MKRFLGPSLLAILIATGGSVAMAQNSETAPAAQEPAAAQSQTEMPSHPAVESQANDEKKSPDATTAAAPSDQAATKAYTLAEGQEWIGKRIYSMEGDDIGEISGVEEGQDGNVAFFHADIGGFLGLGETRVKVEPSKFSLADDKLTLPMTAEEAKELPRVEN